ncbi:hypothetical protein GCM10022248_00830 [Nonomuraea soli]
MSQIRMLAHHKHAKNSSPRRSQRGGSVPEGPIARPRKGDNSVQRAAWKWAQIHTDPTGELPSSMAIACEFARSPRWGRLVKKAGLAGEL